MTKADRGNTRFLSISDTNIMTRRSYALTSRTCFFGFNAQDTSPAKFDSAPTLRRTRKTPNDSALGFMVASHGCRYRSVTHC